MATTVEIYVWDDILGVVRGEFIDFGQELVLGYNETDDACPVLLCEQILDFCDSLFNGLCDAMKGETRRRVWVKMETLFERSNGGGRWRKMEE